MREQSASRDDAWSLPAELWRRLVAEAIGTGFLVLFGAGSVVAALKLGGAASTWPPSA